MKLISSRYLIIHGHFYQPPRENPWIATIEPQESAAPFADWNRRINSECYAPNASSRLLDENALITQLINNYKHLSFNFGPTLFSWLSQADPETYQAIIKADNQAAKTKNGHGPALAQVYNHIIMPLANTRDRLTQIRWGLFDFEHHFGRRPEGLWLAETAVDLETLKMMTEEGLKFTVLSQEQTKAVRPLGSDAGAWKDVSGGKIDPREPYRIFWGKGPKDYLDVFFYDGPVSRAIAFENLLRDGPTLLQRIEQAFGDKKEDDIPRLVNLATDGESYGHHFQFGEMALSWLFETLKTRSKNPDSIQLTNYGHYLSLFPPIQEVRIFENSSWSCCHGVERWRSNCGCNTGGGGNRWNQKWRGPLRNGLNWLRDQLADTFETVGGRYFEDPWRTRDEYIRVITSNYEPNAQSTFLVAQARSPLSGEERTEALSLLEAQLMSLFMFTSCGWFFDEISNLEPVQNLRYALRAIELSQKLTEQNLQTGLNKYLDIIIPNNPDFRTGRDIWRLRVKNGSLNNRLIAAHWIVSNFFNVPQIMDLFSVPRFTNRGLILINGEGLKVTAGLVELTDDRLSRKNSFLCLALYSGGIHLAILTGEYNQPEPPAWLNQSDLRKILGEHLTPATALNIWNRLLQLFPPETSATRFVLEDLLPSCQVKLLAKLAIGVSNELKSQTEDLFHRHQDLLLMNRASSSTPKWEEAFIFRVIGELELQRILKPAHFGRPIDIEALSTLLSRKGLIGQAQDRTCLGEMGQGFLDSASQALTTTMNPRRLLMEIQNFLKIIKQEGFQLDLRQSQNNWYAEARNPIFNQRLNPEEQQLMDALGLILGFNVQAVRAETGL